MSKQDKVIHQLTATQPTLHKFIPGDSQVTHDIIVFFRNMDTKAEFATSPITIRWSYQESECVELVDIRKVDSTALWHIVLHFTHLIKENYQIAVGSQK